MDSGRTVQNKLFRMLTGIIKIILLLLFCLFFTIMEVIGQQMYSDYEGYSVHYFIYKDGILDTNSVNPFPDKVNNSSTCVKYIRSREEIYDNIKMHLKLKMADAERYATYHGNPPKIKLKVYSTAPVGTEIEIQLGKRSEIAYPDGVYSQFQSKTTKQNQWEELEFLFATRPEGSKVDKDEIDQVTLLFAPDSKANYTFYFDELRGPELLKEE
jgi:hypothetical protein